MISSAAEAMMMDVKNGAASLQIDNGKLLMKTAAENETAGDAQEAALKKEISGLLKDLGIPRTSGGFRDCAEAVLLAMDTDELYGALSKVIFPEIAKKHGKSDTAVEKSVRDALTRGWKNGNREKFRAVFGDGYRPLRGRPTVMEFLAAAGDYIKDAG